MNYLQSESDETLVLLTLAGEQTAYEVLVTRHQSRVLQAAASVTKNRYLAEDAAQDAFVSAWIKLNTLTEPEKYGAWVCRIAKNCALNLITRYRRFLPLETVENTVHDEDASQNPAVQYEQSEERNNVSDSVNRLSDRVREIIRLYYYEGLSIVEIADRMRISAGTVKWQLHEGRKQIRKELCAMDEKYSDTLVQRVMKKVEELKLWQLPSDKSGFEKVYRDVLNEVEELPECHKKQHALADVLLRGYWWLPGEKNDAMLARVAEAAEAGQNEEVTAYIVEQEDYKVSYAERAAFIREKQIPRLEKKGFTKTLGTEWYRLADLFFASEKAEEGFAALANAEKLLSPGDLCYELIQNMKKSQEQHQSCFLTTKKEKYEIYFAAEEYRVIGGELCAWKQESNWVLGWLESYNNDSLLIWQNAILCDSRFFADLPVGGVKKGTDGSEISFLSDHEQVETPAGRFEGCALWEARHWTEYGKTAVRTYYKDGVGIVRQDFTQNGMTETHILKAYEIKGGTGLLPAAAGNRWEYVSSYPSSILLQELVITIPYADENRVITSLYSETQRLGYDETSWEDTIQQIASEYFSEDENGNKGVRDIYDVIDRAEALAATPFEKTYTKAAASVARRILDTCETLHPGCQPIGYWNYFQINYVRKQNGRLTLSRYDSQRDFELKRVDDSASEALLYNDIYGILYDNAHAIWSEEWRVGASPVVEYDFDYYHIRTTIRCEDGGTLTVKAGTFDNCLKLTLNCEGLKYGVGYRAGKKVYWFAEGVGIIRVENEICEGRTVVYELTAFTGTGEGFMPLAEGLTRRYEGMNLTDGYFGAADYAYCADEDGDIVIFSDRTGVRNVPPPITEYGYIENEQMEERLWNEGKNKESLLRHDTNNFHLMCYFLGKVCRYWGMPEKSIAWNRYRLKTMENFGDGTVPDAWLSSYALTSFRCACALFGIGKKEEGYVWLEKAFEMFRRWEEIPDDTEMETGDPMIFGGIRFVKGKRILRLPDGKAEPVSNPELFEVNCGILYDGMTAPHGWEWFNPVRDEDRFKAYIERARIMLTEFHGDCSF